MYQYLLKEVQRVYKQQGVDINDKHVEVIVSQMLSKVKIEEAGDTNLLPGALYSKVELDETTEMIRANAGKALLEGSAWNHQSIPGNRFLFICGFLPGNHSSTDRRGHQRQNGPPAGSKGERHHR